ncbi:nucleosomal histone kinase 1-like [Phlebotomus argentipes]|uniref:nucleosomal histone kinase 1-like n=1 Tax=Phlebotomus argentipes TaxID=94469 RepID=UPI0028931160|nr:nucleosomal histone kinase 1-like [Phlebotomus argentipes]
MVGSSVWLFREVREITKGSSRTLRQMASKGKAKAPARPRKKANGYSKSVKLTLGSVLRDLEKKDWLVGPAIGSGGFGDIYSCCEAEKAPRSTDDYQSVLKIEPYENGPLFVEMHFYIRNTKTADIEAFKKARKLKNLGMPYLLGRGSHELQGEKHRFVVMPRYGSDIWKIFINNGRQIPLHTVYRLAIQMIDVLEYIHEATYIHGDLKGANILLGFGKGGGAQAYLVDFGLATHFTTKDFKPDPKQMHNGTIEYTSRDAHLGVQTRRGDLEILGYNLVQWCASKLPWEAPETLKVPTKVQEAKEKFMKDVRKSLKDLFAGDYPRPLEEFLQHVRDLKHDEAPDYDKCRQMFAKALKTLGKTNSGDLEFAAVSLPLKKAKKEAINAAKRSPKRPRDSDSVSPEKKLRVKREKSPAVAPSPSPKRKIDAAKAKTEVTKATGKTKKLYKVNLELDISLDADVVVNVQRKPKSVATRKSPRAIVSTPKPASDDECIADSQDASPRKRATKAKRPGKTLVSIQKDA